MASILLPRGTTLNPLLPALAWGALLLAGVLRLVRLDVVALSPLEAPRALAAWQLLQDRAPQWWEAPGLAVPMALTFFLFGDSEATARLVPALAGTGIIAAVAIHRGWLGWGGFTACAMLLALSPSALVAARSVVEDSLAGLVTLLMGWALVHSWDRLRGYIPVFIAVGWALLLHLGFAGVTGALALLLFGVLWSTLRPGGVRVSSPAWLRDAPGLFFVFASTFVVTGTGILLYLNGVGLPSLAAWAREIETPAGGAGWLQPWLALAGYEPVALVAGLPAVVLALRHWRGRITEPAASSRAFLALWALFGLVMLVMDGQGTPSTVFTAALPLTVLAGDLLGRLLSDAGRTAVIEFARALPFVAAGLVFGWLNLLKWAGDSSATDVPLLVGFVAGAVSCMAAAALAVSGRRTGQVLTLFALCFALVAQIHAVSRLADPWLGIPQTEEPAVRLLAGTTTLMPYTAAAAAAGVVVQDDLRAVLAWEFRNVRAVAFIPQLRAGPALLIGDSSADFPGYDRRTVAVYRFWLPAAWAPKDAVRWLATGDVPESSVTRRRAGVYVATNTPVFLGTG